MPEQPPQNDTWIDHTVDDARDAFHVHALGVGFAGRDIHELVPPEDRPLVTMGVNGVWYDPDNPAGRPQHITCLMPSWTLAGLHGALDAMWQQMPPEVQTRWLTERMRIGNLAPATLANMKAEIDRDADQTSTPVSAHNSDYGVAEEDPWAAAHRAGHHAHGGVPDCVLCGTQNPDYGVACSDHPEFRPDSLYHLQQHLEEHHALDLAGARYDPADLRCGYAGGLCGLPIVRLANGAWQHIDGEQSHDAVGPDTAPCTVTNAEQYAGAVIDNPTWVRCRGACAQDYAPAGVCAAHGICAVCHPPVSAGVDAC